jgi:predicted alpha/beta hydrolase
MGTLLPPAVIERQRVSVAIPGGTLAVTKLGPSDGNFRACVIINCAMSVKQSFYRPFAEFLAGIGYSVFTWDYRGVGDSAMDSRTARTVSLDQWAYDDLSLVIAAAVTADAGLPIFVVGHSFGGQIISLPENRNAIRGALLVACPSGYVGHWRGTSRGAFMWGLAYFGIPLLTRLYGRFPASRLRLGADLPRKVALEWGRWLRHPRYIARSPGRSARIASFSAPIHAISLSDDEFAPPHAVEAMLSLYRGSVVTREVVSPEDHGLRSIGHMGFFRPRTPGGIWQVAADRIDALLRLARKDPAIRSGLSINGAILAEAATDLSTLPTSISAGLRRSGAADS